MRHWSWMVVLSVGSISGMGCALAPLAGGAATAVVKVVRGCDAKGTVVSGCVSTTLAGYHGLDLGQVTTDVPPIVTDEVLGKIRPAVEAEVADKRTLQLFPGGPPVLRSEVLCRYYREKKFFGGDGRLDWLVTLQDAQTGEIVGTVHIAGSSGSPFQHGPGDLAQENTAELVTLLSKLMVGMGPYQESGH